MRASVENFGLNNFKNEQFQSHLGSIEVLEGLTQKDRAELLLCNILAPVIEELAPKFERIVTDEGSGFLSGLLLDQAPLLIEALDPLGWRTVELIQLDQWCLLHIRRRISKKHKKT